tara:strand:- start:52028 stop:52138 length:111 start_codon:yes stop_codon:yes gene_type:complete
VTVDEKIKTTLLPQTKESLKILAAHFKVNFYAHPYC